MADLALDLDDRDDIDFVQLFQPILAGALRRAMAPDAYVIKIDSWFGASWLGFSFKALGALGISNRRKLRVPPFVPARVVSQRFYCRARSGRYHAGPAPVALHIVQASEDNRRRFMSAVCPGAAALWWSGSSRPNGRACAMAYLPSGDGHVAWYAEFQRARAWTFARTVGTSQRELADLATDDRAGEYSHAADVR
jgi:hypothetical protein